MTPYHSYQILETSKMIDYGAYSVILINVDTALIYDVSRNNAEFVCKLGWQLWPFDGLISIYDFRVLKTGDL